MASKALLPLFGSFPEDVEIPARMVLRMWIAEGFVSPNAYDDEREITVEDVAEQYLMELVNRGMVQGRSDWSGKIIICRLHDLMRDLCVSKARQERFLSILKVQQDDGSKDCSSSMGIEVESTSKTRRLSLNMHVSTKGNTVEQIGRTMLCLRTLMFFGYGEEMCGMQFQPIFINCKFLRVLKLEDFDWMTGDLPESVGDLLHLRFLSLARSTFESLPQSMGNLVCMEFLDLHVDFSIRVTMPNVLWKMKRLRYLRLPSSFHVNSSGVQKKLMLDTLKNLRTLKNFNPRNCNVNDVGKLTNLQKLSAQLLLEELEIIPQLAKSTLKHLRSSSFRIWGDLFTESKLSKMSIYPYSCKLSIFGRIEKLPDHHNLPQQLRKLILLYSRLEEDPMPILEKLQHLVVLVLGYKAFVGKEMVCSAGGFPQLKHLLLSKLYDLEEWRVAEGAMPHLSRLGISDCPQLKGVPPGVSIYDCSEEVDEEKNKYLAVRSKGEHGFRVKSRTREPEPESDCDSRF